jgi:hypothetical protein
MREHGRGTRPLLAELWEPPPKPWIRPHRRAAEIGWSDGTWWPVTVLAWARLDPPRYDMLTMRTAEWAVCLRRGDDTVTWYEHDAHGLRSIEH